jgi:hypothetical protein
MFILSVGTSGTSLCMTIFKAPIGMSTLNEFNGMRSRRWRYVSTRVRDTDSVKGVCASRTVQTIKARRLMTVSRSNCRRSVRDWRQVVRFHCGDYESGPGLDGNKWKNVFDNVSGMCKHSVCFVSVLVCMYLCCSNTHTQTHTHTQTCSVRVAC